MVTTSPISLAAVVPEGKNFQAISIKGTDFEQSISRNKRGDLYFTGTSMQNGTKTITEYRSLSLAEAKEKLYEMIMGVKKGDAVKVDYKV